jgi:hypothetical protein
MGKERAEIGKWRKKALMHGRLDLTTPCHTPNRNSLR